MTGSHNYGELPPPREEGSKSRPVAADSNSVFPYVRKTRDEGPESRTVAAVVEGMGGGDHTPARIGRDEPRRRTFVAA